jgi:hypothetical protein
MEEQQERELGITTVILEQFEHRTLPEALWIKEKVDKGECLSEGDIEFLERILENAGNIKGFIDTHPEYQSLYTKIVDLYEDITAKALENEQAAVAQKGGTDV